MARRGAKVQNTHAPFEALMDSHGVEYTYVASIALEDITRDADSQAP